MFNCFIFDMINAMIMANITLPVTSQPFFFYIVYYPEKTLACASFHCLSSEMYIEVGWD